MNTVPSSIRVVQDTTMYTQGSTRYRKVGTRLTGSAVITHDVTTGTGYCLVGFNWIIDFLN